ncbi:LysM repeat protein [Microbacterium resistens]|uniref:LysM repeat protein n=1 Tax=Microbacterium resistens TaxID=156977 RepID=A0ABU1SDV9_9MICO|nr:LysM peptidoglycan-binding domain-containing protein [Microbacterium resistens]MDR6867796.1 LysM repeat protein [Microbacterium resistens]
MTPQIARRRTNALGWVAPAAVLGALTGSLAVAPAASAEDYTVVEGDTLFDVARRFDVSVADLRLGNALPDTGMIHPGDVLCVEPQTAPAATAQDAQGTVASSDPMVDAVSYEVGAGDTLWAIAESHGTTVAAIYAANGLGPDSIIYPGQSLLLVSPDAVAIPAMAPDEAPSTEAAPPLAPETALDAEQAGNAALIIGIGRALGVPERGIEIALGAAMVESGLRNLPGGDRDSIGLFQQRTSTGWGTAAEIADPAHSISAFFRGVDGAGGPTAIGLLDVAEWEALPFTDAAQSVQLSAYPLRYGAWEEQAAAWVADHG